MLIKMFKHFNTYLSNNTPRKNKLSKIKQINNKYTKAIKKIEEHKETSDDFINKVNLEIFQKL